MKNLKMPFAALLLASVTACAHGGSRAADTKKEAGQPSPESVEAIKKRASFELSCPESELQVSVIEAGNMMRAWTFGAAGCNKKATYLYRMGTIINNSAASN